MAKMLICSRRWAFFVPVGFINGSGVNSKIGVSTVSVVRRIRDARLFKRSRTSEIFDMPKPLICSDKVLFSDLAIASKSRFSSYVHLNVILSVNFSDIENYLTQKCQGVILPKELFVHFFHELFLPVLRKHYRRMRSGLSCQVWCRIFWRNLYDLCQTNDLLNKPINFELCLFVAFGSIWI